MKTESDKTLILGHRYPDTIQYAINQTFRFGLISDIHIGAAGFDKNYFHRYMERMHDECDFILINGDTMDLLLPKDYKRYSPDVVDPKFGNRSDIINASLEYAAKTLEPYADKIVLMGDGNHESVLQKYHSINVTKLLIKMLGDHIAYGGFCGFYKFFFRNGDSSGRNLVIYYHHGMGGHAPVSKGMIDFNRMDVQIDKADVIWFGHKHVSISDKSVRMGLSEQCKVYTRECIHVITSTFVRPLSSQFAVERGFSPNPMGGAILECKIGKNGKELLIKH